MYIHRKHIFQYFNIYYSWKISQKKPFATSSKRVKRGGNIVQKIVGTMMKSFVEKNRLKMLRIAFKLNPSQTKMLRMIEISFCSWLKFRRIMHIWIRFLSSPPPYVRRGIYLFSSFHYNPSFFVTFTKKFLPQIIVHTWTY